jgi:hypothetical protein
MPPALDEIDALLRITPVFRRLAPEDRRRIAQAATVKRYQKGDIRNRVGAALERGRRDAARTRRAP